MTIVVHPTRPDAAVRVLPGLAVVTAAACLAYAISWLAPSINPSTAAVILGALLTNAGLHRPALR
ncbi:MAG TPA: hypothetical protein VGH11_00825, partial [Jatrophihabitans sp.]